MISCLILSVVGFSSQTDRVWYFSKWIRIRFEELLLWKFDKQWARILNIECFYITDDGRSRSLQSHRQHGDLISASGQADHGEWRARQLLAPSKEKTRVRLRLIDSWNRESFPRFMQACSPCDSDFLNFENRLKDTSPAGHFERTQKDSRDSFSSTTGLPDLDWTKKSVNSPLCSLFSLALLRWNCPSSTSGKEKRK